MTEREHLKYDERVQMHKELITAHLIEFTDKHNICCEVYTNDKSDFAVTLHRTEAEDDPDNLLTDELVLAYDIKEDSLYCNALQSAIYLQDYNASALYNLLKLVDAYLFKI